MTDLNISNISDKDDVFVEVRRYLDELNIKIADTTFDKPWGGFFVIDNDSTEQFIKQFFPQYSYDDIANGLELTPKILVPAPGMRLSWQYHFRREEIWSVVSGPVGYVTSDTDEQGEVQRLNNGEVVSFGTQIRHRLIGLDEYGVVAEFWKHTDASNPSDEADIVRVQDDFSRN